MHKDRQAMPKPFLPKGSRTWHIHPRVPKQFRGVVGATHVTRSLKTQDLREAKRRVHAVMDSLYAEWEAKQAAASTARPSAKQEDAFTTAVGGVRQRRPPNIEHACAVYRAKLREHVKIVQGMVAERFRLGVGGGVPKEKAAQALREWLFEEAEDVDASLTTGVFDVVLRCADGWFDEEDLRDPKLVTALALTHKRFYDALLPAQQPFSALPASRRGSEAGRPLWQARCREVGRDTG